MTADNTYTTGETVYTPPLRTLSEIIADLSQPIPDYLLKPITKGGQQITTFSWVTAQQLLDRYAPGWEGHAVLVMSSERVGCVYDLRIPTSDFGVVQRSATGDDTEDDEGETEQERKQRQYGSPTTRAEGQAFKRAAARFGLGVYLRTKQGGNSQGGQGQPQYQPQQNGGGLGAGGSAASEKQIGAIYAIARGAKRLSEDQTDDLCVETFGVRPQELTKSEASQFIDQLKG